MSPTKTFYRVCNNQTKQGLWYDITGTFTGLIHNQFNFCMNHTLQMEFDEELVDYLSATDDYDKLFDWFSKQDILKLQEHGYAIYEYQSEDYKFYDRFQHFVINKHNSRIIKKISLTNEQ